MSSVSAGTVWTKHSPPIKYNLGRWHRKNIAGDFNKQLCNKSKWRIGTWYHKYLKRKRITVISLLATCVLNRMGNIKEVRKRITMWVYIDMRLCKFIYVYINTQTHTNTQTITYAHIIYTCSHTDTDRHKCLYENNNNKRCME